MNEQLRKWLENLRTQFDQLSQQKKILMVSTAVLIALGLTAVTIVLRRDPQQVLYSDLKPEDSKAVAKKLSEQNIPYQASEDGSTITVAASQVYQARMQLAKDGLPGQDVVGFEKFDSSTIGMSSYVQRIQYVRAIQGELTRSVQRLASVKTARVHISLPPKKTFLEEEEPPKASVVLELRTGQTPSKQEIAGIAHLVSSAVEGLKTNQISIVDTKGNFLYRPEDAGLQAIPTALLDMQRNIESEYEHRIEDLLTPVVGIGKVRAKVTAEIDPSRVNTTEETFDPDKAIARTVNKVDEISQGSRPNPIGIPGSRSNLPGTEANNPPNQSATNTNEKNSSNASYAIPRKVQVTEKPSGTIKRLTVAVVVDGHYAKDGGKEVFSPRNDAELKRLQDIIANAVGFDSQRRDSITVSSLPFGTEDIAPPEEAPLPWWNWKELSKHGVRNIVIGLVTLLFFFLVLRPFLAWITGADVKKKKIEEVVAVQPKTVVEVEAAVEAAQNTGISAEQAAQELLALSKAQAEEEDDVGLPDDKDTTGKRRERDLRERIIEKLTESPKKGLRIVQEWLEEDANGVPGIPQVSEG